MAGTSPAMNEIRFEFVVLSEAAFEQQRSADQAGLLQRAESQSASMVGIARPRRVWE